MKKNKTILLICFIIGSLSIHIFLDYLGEQSGVKLKINEIKEEYTGVITKKLAPRNIKPTHLEIKIAKNNYIEICPNNAIIKSSNIGDTIIKPKNENFVYLINSKRDTTRFFYTKLSHKTRDNKLFPKEWKNKWIQSTNKSTFNTCLNTIAKSSFENYFEDNNFNYLDSLSFIESKMKKNKILNSTDKESYFNYVNGLKNGVISKKRSDLKKIQSFSYFFEYINMSPTMFILLTNCCECNNMTYKERIGIYDAMKIDNGYPSKKNLLKLIEITNFKNKHERLILLNFIYIHLKAFIDDNISGYLE